MFTQTKKKGKERREKSDTIEGNFVAPRFLRLLSSAHNGRPQCRYRYRCFLDRFLEQNVKTGGRRREIETSKILFSKEMSSEYNSCFLILTIPHFKRIIRVTSFIDEKIRIFRRSVRSRNCIYRVSQKTQDLNLPFLH